MIIWSFDSGNVVFGCQEWDMGNAIVSVLDVMVLGKIWRNQKVTYK